MKEVLLASLQEQARPIRGVRVLLYGFSARGHPGGDGVYEAVDVLPQVGVEVAYTHALDTDLRATLARDYDITIVAHTKIDKLLHSAPARLWHCAKKTVLLFWDLRPGNAGALLRDCIDQVFIPYTGRWRAPNGALHDPAQWGAVLGCPVGYAPPASPLRTPAPGRLDAPRVLFVGDLANTTYHYGRKEMCSALGATVLDRRDKAGRLGIEAQLPALYASARYCLSMSPRAPGCTSIRTYSILACGGLLLLHKFPGCERLFEDGQNAIVFDTADDALERLIELDGDEAARVRIAAAGRELHARKHTVAHRVVSICGEVLRC